LVGATLSGPATASPGTNPYLPDLWRDLGRLAPAVQPRAGYNNGLAGFPLFTIYIVLYGALLARLRLRSESVWPCAILHAAGNYQSYVLLALTMVRPGFSGASPAQSTAILEYAVTMLAGVVALVLAGRANR
jgi:membrane protease YdiL (CAAX protease family)